MHVIIELVFPEMSSNKDLSADNFFLAFLLEDLQRHSCPACQYQQFEYVRHMKSKNVVALSGKKSIRSDAAANFETVRGTLQDCPIIRYQPPKDALFVSIVPGDVCHIDSVYIGGIFQVCQLPVTRIAIDGHQGNAAWKRFEMVSTPGSSFSTEFHNGIFEEFLPAPRHHNSILYTTSSSNAHWSMLNFSGDSLQLFNSIEWRGKE